MKRHCLVLLIVLAAFASQAAQPLRVFIRAGAKTHGPGQHDHPRFLQEWKPLLNERGARAEGAMNFPTAEQLEQTDVLVIYAADGTTIQGEQRTNFEKFLQKGGGVVVIHDGIVGKDAPWTKSIFGGAWVWGKTKWLEGEVGQYIVEPEHPIVRGISNWDWKDEIYYEMDMAEDAKVIGTSFHSVFVIAPQLWTVEKTIEGGKAPYRAFVSLPGHEHVSFNTPQYRSILMRGIAWAGKRQNVDELCQPAELASLKYPPGGPIAPEKAAATFNLHPEFEMSLVAAEPLIEKPISLDWDHKGRLWIAETPEYPAGRTINQNDRMVALWDEKDPASFKNNKEDRPARDRISWVEDTNGDGRMDRKQVFYEGLELVTSLVFYKDGVIVAQAPDILWLRDKDGDGKAETVEKLITGFGTRDTHATINNFRWGFDGWVYGAVGYSGGDPKSGDGSISFGKHASAIFRFKPDGKAFEVLASTACNTWGFDFGWDGEMYYTTPTCGDHAIHIAMPERYVARGSLPGLKAQNPMQDHTRIKPAVHHTRPAYVQIDVVGGFTAAAGACLYNGGAWPEKHDNTFFVSEPTVSLVHQDFLSPKNSSYVASREQGREETEFLTGTDLWFRPIHQRVGPDGALYILDFYNQAAIHNDTRGPKHGANNAATRPDRDHHFGRIWRIQHKQAKNLPAYNLDPQKTDALLKALEHPNGWVRSTAQRLLLQSPNNAPVAKLTTLAEKGSTPAGRIHALGALQALGKLDDKVLLAAISDKDAAVRKNGLRYVAEKEQQQRDTLRETVARAVKDKDPRAQLQAILALGSFPPGKDIAQTLIQTWPDAGDKYVQSAIIGVAGKDALLLIRTALESDSDVAGLLKHTVRQMVAKKETEQAAALVKLLAANAQNKQTEAVLETLATEVKDDFTPAWNNDLKASLTTLLKSNNSSVSGAALPLVARWDKEGSMAEVLKPIIATYLRKLPDKSLPEDERAQIAANVLGMRKLDATIVPAVAKLLGKDSSPALQRRVIEAMGSISDAAVGEQLVNEFANLSPEVREEAFTQIVKRPEWSLALLKAMSETKIELATVGPVAVHRLRTHSDRKVADRALMVVNELRGPEQKEKEKLITQYLHEVEKPGDVTKGKQLFDVNCGVCHTFKGAGRNVAPDLTGMGVHGAHDLLVHILDPNRLVEPNYITVSIETKDETSYDGIIGRENRSSILLRTATSDVEVRQADIKSRRSTGRSLMPEGFEALGGEGLRNIIAYISADDTKYRILNLGPAFTVTSARGIYISSERLDDTLQFKKFGLIKAGDVPFDVVNPARTENGRNLIVLKGGEGLAKTFPQKVEIPAAGIKATKLHFLGGVGGWAWPFGGEQTKDVPVAKVIVDYADRKSEEIVLRNGIEFVDYRNASAEAAGSRKVDDLVKHGQVRWFTKSLKHVAPIQKVTIESYNNSVAPTFVAITAEAASDQLSAAGSSLTYADASASGGARSDASTATRPPFKWEDGTKVLIVGGGSSHDFGKWFNAADTAILKSAGASVNYTEKISDVRGALKDIDVLYLSNNQPMEDPQLRAEIFKFAEAGKGLLLVHPALWYNWKDWPEYNRQLVGGGARGHDKIGEFEVTVVRPSHPVVANVPKTFKITDELYYFMPDEKGAAIEVLATSKSPLSNKVFPTVWVTKHPKARIACITLGHDGRAHEHEAYKKLLTNSLKWASGKD